MEILILLIVIALIVGKSDPKILPHMEDGRGRDPHRHDTLVG